MAGDRRGRRHRGERFMFHVRVPVAVADVVLSEAAKRGQSRTDYVADLLAREHGFTTGDEPRRIGAGPEYDDSQQLDLGVA